MVDYNYVLTIIIAYIFVTIFHKVSAFILLYMVSDFAIELLFSEIVFSYLTCVDMQLQTCYYTPKFYFHIDHEAFNNAYKYA